MDNPNIPRGETLYGTDGTVPSSYTESVGYEGQRIVDPDGTVRRLVRNVKAGALLPGTMVTWASGYTTKRVDAYSNADAELIAGVVDDQLPAAGVRAGDVFNLIVGGLVDCLPSPGTSDVTGTLSPGIFLISSATSGGDGGFKPYTTYSGTGAATVTQLGTGLGEREKAFAILTEQTTAADAAAGTKRQVYVTLPW